MGRGEQTQVPVLKEMMPDPQRVPRGWQGMAEQTRAMTDHPDIELVLVYRQMKHEGMLILVPSR
jgi:hypothetical protein